MIFMLLRLILELIGEVRDKVCASILVKPFLWATASLGHHNVMCGTVMLVTWPTENLRLVVDKNTVRFRFILREEVVLGLLKWVHRGIFFVSASHVINSSEVLLVRVYSLCDGSGENRLWQIHWVGGLIIRDQSHLFILLKLLERVFFIVIVVVLGIDRFIFKADTILIILHRRRFSLLN